MRWMLDFAFYSALCIRDFVRTSQIYESRPKIDRVFCEREDFKIEPLTLGAFIYRR